MPKRLVKQIIYGLGYLVIIFFILFMVYFVWFKLEPTCFDRRQNQGETGVDCGGSCAACEIKTLLPLQSNWKHYFSINGKAALSAQIKNSNINYGASRFSYNFEVYNKNGAKIKTIFGGSFIYASEIKYILELTDIDYESIGEIKILFPDVQWLTGEKFSKPKTQIRGRLVKKSDDGREIEMSGYIINENPYSLKKVRIIGFLATQNNIKISVSKTEFEDLRAFEEKYFKIIFPKDINLLSSATSSALDFLTADASRTEIYVEAIK